MSGLLLLVLALGGCASLEESLFGWGEITNDPSRLHEAAKAEIEAAWAAQRAVPSDPNDETTPPNAEISTPADSGLEWKAASAVRKLRHLRERFPEYGERDELDLLLVRGRFASGQWNEGFKELKAFVQRHPLSHRPTLQELLETYGERALNYHPTFLDIDFVGTEKLGEEMLAFLTTQFPSSLDVVQRAQQRLANHLYDRDRYGEALLYYDKIANGPPGIWTDFARFRRALCLTRSIGSRDLDASSIWAAEEANLIYPGEDGLTLAARLFREYLEQPRITRRNQAEIALEQTYRMLRDRELDLASYYDRIDNAVGRELHEDRARGFQARLVELQGPPEERVESDS